jgi:hypothetical protein
MAYRSLGEPGTVNVFLIFGCLKRPCLAPRQKIHPWRTRYRTSLSMSFWVEYFMLFPASKIKGARSPWARMTCPGEGWPYKRPVSAGLIKCRSSPRLRAEQGRQYRRAKLSCYQSATICQRWRAGLFLHEASAVERPLRRTAFHSLLAYSFV